MLFVHLIPKCIGFHLIKLNALAAVKPDLFLAHCKYIITVSIRQIYKRFRDRCIIGKRVGIRCVLLALGSPLLT